MVNYNNIEKYSMIKRYCVERCKMHNIKIENRIKFDGVNLDEAKEQDYRLGAFKMLANELQREICYIFDIKDIKCEFKKKDIYEVYNIYEIVISDSYGSIIQTVGIKI